MPRGRSSSRSRAASSSRSRIVSSSVSHASAASSHISAAASARSSRSQSRARVRKSRKSSMETMEEEPEDANMSNGNMNRYNDAPRGREMTTKGGEVTARGRGISRGREAARARSQSRTNSVNVLQAVAAAAETSHRGKSLPRKRNDAATQAAMAAALNEVNRSKQNRSRSKSRTRNANPSFKDIDAHLRRHKVKSRSFHDDNPMPQQQQPPNTKSRSFHNHKPSPPHYQHTKPSRRSSRLSRKTSRSVSPSRSKTIARNSYDIAASVASSDSSASSTFSAFDRRIAENFNVAPTLATRDIQHASSSEMALCEKANTASSTHALLDKNGCCALHPYIQLRLLSDGKWRTLAKHCVVCREEASASNAITSTVSAAIDKKLNYRRSTESGARPKITVQEKTRASVAIMEMCESGECSLTPSFLEAGSDDDEPTIPSKNDEESSRDSVNSCVEHKAKTSVTASSRASHGVSKSSPRELPPMEVSIPNIETFDEEGSLKSKQSLDLNSLHTLEQNDTKSVKSIGSMFKRHQVIEQDDTKSVRSTATWRRNHIAADQDDVKSVRSTATAKRYCQTSGKDDSKSGKSNATARMKKSSSKTAIDMTLVDSVVESAMQKIKSMDEFQKISSEVAVPQVKTPVEAAAPITRMNPPPPPPRTQSSKNLSKTNAKLSPPSHNGLSNNSSLQRPPPPPPPPRSHMKTVNSVASSMAQNTPTPPVTTDGNTVDYGCSMNVLNPDPEPELQSEFDNDFDEMIPPFEQMEVSGMVPNDALNSSPGPVNAPAKDWMAYCITSSGREGKDVKGGKRRIFGRNSAKSADKDREIIRSVRQMPFTDQFGDFGLYTGQVNEDGRPDGKGSMKYDNGGKSA